VPKTDGARPKGYMFWKNKVLEKKERDRKDRKAEKFDKWLIPRILKASIGNRLTFKRMALILISEELIK
jgi:hypothetical protein